MRPLPSLGWLSFLLIVGSHSFMEALAEEDQGRAVHSSGGFDNTI
jgi:hypothetical protein